MCLWKNEFNLTNTVKQLTSWVNVAAIQGEGYLLKFSTNSGLNKLTTKTYDNYRSQFHHMDIDMT